MTSDCVGGVWSYATTLCRGLGELGVDVTLAVSGGEMTDAQRTEAATLANVDLRHEPFKCEWMQPPLADVKAAGRWLDHRPLLTHKLRLDQLGEALELTINRPVGFMKAWVSL